jgi:hypothetical protein
MRRVHAGLVAALALSLLSSARAEKKDAPPHVHRSPVMQQCIDACHECTNQCETCFVHCTGLVASGKKEHIPTLKSCVDCGDLCAMAAKIMSRDGALIGPACEGCARGCDDCAAACEKFPDDAHMKACAKSCRACSKACREMVKSAGTNATRVTD